MGLLMDVPEFKKEIQKPFFKEKELEKKLPTFAGRELFGYQLVNRCLKDFVNERTKVTYNFHQLSFFS